MATNTYAPIATYTASGSTNTINFNSIPQTYTDLRLVVSARSNVSNTLEVMDMYINGVASGGLYSTIQMLGDSSTASSQRWAGVNVLYRPALIAGNTAAANVFSSSWTDFYNYTNTTTWKTTLTQFSDEKITLGYSGQTICTYRSTAAITQIAVITDSGNTFTAGSVFTLYGILAA